MRRSGGDDVRRDLMRREMERREMEHRDIHNRLGGRIAPPVHEIEMRLEEQRRRLISEREREREVLRRELQMEHARKEQELARHVQEIQEREERDRSMLERQQREIVQLQRNFRERESHLEAKERELKDKEMREKQRFEMLERQREKELREKEKRYRDQLEREVREKELRVQREQKAMEQQLREHEKMIQERERKIREEQERLAKYKEEVERQRRKEDEDRKERDKRSKEEKDREEKDRSKRPPIDDSGIFGRLGTRDNPQQSNSRSGIVKETQISPNLTYRRFESGSSKPSMNRPVTNPYSQNQSRSKALESLSTNYTTPRSHENEPIMYPQPSRYTSSVTNHYGRDSSHSVGYGSSSNVGQYPPPTNKAVSSFLNNPEFLTQAAQVLSNVARGSGLPPTGGPAVYPGATGYIGNNMGRTGGNVGTYFPTHQTGIVGSTALPGRPGYPIPSVGGGEQPRFQKPLNKMPQEPERYRRVPPRPPTHNMMRDMYKRM